MVDHVQILILMQSSGLWQAQSRLVQMEDSVLRTDRRVLLPALPCPALPCPALPCPALPFTCHNLLVYGTCYLCITMPDWYVHPQLSCFPVQATLVVRDIKQGKREAPLICLLDHMQ